MPEDEQSTPGVIPVAAKEIIAQLRAMSRWLEGLVGNRCTDPVGGGYFPVARRLLSRTADVDR
jgi:hypothetical protein